MRNFVITTDNTADLPYDYYKKNQIEYLFLSYTMDGKNYQKNAILPSVLVSCMTNQLIHAEYEKTHYGTLRDLI